jgi:homocysteine S-methyltransferase
MARPLIVDGGLATTLEERGHALHPRLWSAGTFLADPGAVEDVHVAFLEAGARILISASYQMSFEGLAARGLDRQAAAAAMRRTVEVARRAVERTGIGDARVAASIGPYGATLADGSEYRGDHGLSVEQLADFHRERLGVLARSGADLLAIETVPSLEEARALMGLLAEIHSPPAWISFSCRDAVHLSDGRPVREAAKLCRQSPRVAAVGVNCTAPRHVAGLIDEIRAAGDGTIVVYPNSGETWDAGRRDWSGDLDTAAFVGLAQGWAAQGVRAIGGCCRVGPAAIRELAAALGG